MENGGSGKGFQSGKKLTGWKMISRFLGRSERAVQLWEAQRGLPIRRIPGRRGQTVFAYEPELEAWMNQVTTEVANAPHLESGPRSADAESAQGDGARSVRPPGILILPMEHRSGVDPCGAGDLLCQQLIVRLTAVQPVRVLSWTTSRSVAQGLESIPAAAQRLNVRYFVECGMEQAGDVMHVEVRVIDVDVDQIVLADRFAVPRQAPCTVYGELAEGVALHFSLLHAGALVEPMCLVDMEPWLFLEYLGAAHHFHDGLDESPSRVLGALDALLKRRPDFAPAQAMRGLALLEFASGPADAAILEEARTILSRCADGTAARVTSAFLGAAIVKHANRCGVAAPVAVKTALRWIPPSIARHGRLYERRSLVRRNARDAPTHQGADDRRGKGATNLHPLRLGALLDDLVAVHRNYDPCGNLEGTTMPPGRRN